MNTVRTLLTRLGRGSLATVAGCLLLIVAGWTITLERVRYEREEAIDEAVQQNDKLAVAFAQQASRSVQALDQAVRFLRHQYLAKDDAGRASAFVEGGWVDRGLFSYVALVDAGGRVAATNTARRSFSVADRDYFVYHAHEAGDDLYISAPTISRHSNAPVVHASRGMRDASGRFLGVALVAVSPQYFTDLLKDIDVGRDGVVQIVGLDGIARARRIGAEITYGQDISGSTLLQQVAAQPAGHFIAGGRLDGVQRYMSYRTVPGFPLVAAVATSVRETHAAPKARELNYYAGASAATLVVILFGAGLLVALARQRRAVEQKRRSEASFRATFEEAPIGITHTSLDGRFLKVNRKFCEMVGYAEAELLRRGYVDITPPEDREATLRARVRVLGGHPALPEIEKRNVRKDGGVIWVMVTYALVRDADGRPDYFVAMIRDVTRRREAEETARRSAAALKRAQAMARLSHIVTGPGGAFESHSGTVAELLGLPAHAMPADARAWLAHIHPEDRARFRAVCLEAGRTKARADVEYRLLRGDGATVHVRQVLEPLEGGDGPERWFNTLQDVSEQKRDIAAREQAEARVLYQMNHDPLTDLPNRVLCYDRLEQALGQARRSGRGVGVLVLDLDRFKTVNDSLGHALGDALLREAASRLRACVRGGDTIARVGGDEFGVVLTELAQPQDAALVARKVLEAFAAPAAVAGHEVFVSASIGIATCPPDGVDADTLLKNAGVAMRRAKDLGRNNFQFYAAEMNARATDKLAMESALRRAIERDEFVLHFQPKAALPAGRLTGFEALLRWRRGGQRLVSPGEFIPLLEESGMIVQAGEWVIGAACAQIAAWRRAGFAALPVAVNVSAKQFGAGLEEGVRAALAAHGVEPGMLELEITESDAMREPARVLESLQRLRALGVRISIDDFGTGYSSLGYLKRFPAHKLKLDRSFVTGLPEDPDDVSIARAVIGMAHSLGMQVVAEGVETEAQRSFLAHDGCDEMQGYLLSRPLPAGECEALLATASAGARARSAPAPLCS